MRIFVTGALGFVGGHLLPALAAAGHEVLPAGSGFELTDEAAVVDSIVQAAPDAIIHLAAQSSVATSITDPQAVFRTNTLGTLFLLRAASEHSPRARVLLVGSGQVYGSAVTGARPFREQDPLRPESPYARTKAASDLLGKVFSGRGLDVVRVRPFNHTGPGQSTIFVVPNFARQIAEIERGLREPKLEVGNLASVRDFLDVEDVIEAYRRLLDPKVPSGVYNLASGVGHSMGEVLETLLELSTVRPEVVVAPQFFRATDACVGDFTRLREATHWTPTLSFRETLARVLNAWRETLSTQTES